MCLMRTKMHKTIIFHGDIPLTSRRQLLSSGVAIGLFVTQRLAQPVAVKSLTNSW